MNSQSDGDRQPSPGSAGGGPSDMNGAPTQLSGRLPKPFLDPTRVARYPWGPYVLTEPIGSGGMAAVFRARDVNLDRIVALKILPPDAAGDRDQVARFRQEAKAAAMLDHENVARVFGSGDDQGLHY